MACIKYVIYKKKKKEKKNTYTHARVYNLFYVYRF